MQEALCPPPVGSPGRFLAFAFAAAELLAEADAEGAFPARFGQGYLFGRPGALPGH